MPCSAPVTMARILQTHVPQSRVSRYNVLGEILMLIRKQGGASSRHAEGIFCLTNDGLK